MRIAIKVVLCMVGGALLAAATADPVIGRWTLNWEKSRTSDAKPKSVVRTYRQSGRGVRVSESWTDADGKEFLVDYVGFEDGRDHPLPNTNGDTVLHRRVDFYTVEGVRKTNGKPVYTFERRVSQDRQTLTITINRTLADGKASTDVLVYDRLK